MNQKRWVVRANRVAKWNEILYKKEIKQTGGVPSLLELFSGRHRRHWHQPFSISTLTLTVMMGYITSSWPSRPRESGADGRGKISFLVRAPRKVNRGFIDIAPILRHWTAVCHYFVRFFRMLPRFMVTLIGFLGISTRLNLPGAFFRNLFSSLPLFLGYFPRRSH